MPSKIEEWLKKHGLQAYGPVFAANSISLELLPHLTDTDLKELGLSVGHRVIFRRAAEGLAGDDAALPELPNSIAAEPPDFAGERKLISVLFCDIVESTRLSTMMDAEELDDVLHAFFTRCATIAEGFGGMLATKLGDGAVCLFGYPRAHEDDSLRAVHAALAMAREIPLIVVPSSPDWRLNVRVGVATGHVVISISSDEKIPQIVGETPNLAERIKTACPVASVVIDPTTHRLVGANFEMVELGAQLLKGFGASMQVYHVVAPRSVTRFEGRHSAGAVRRLVGRQGDMAMLTSRWTLVAQGEGQVVLLTGRAGIGKSRLATAVAEFAADKDCNVQLYQCSHLYHNTALHPVISRIMRDSEIKLTDKAEVKLTKLRGMLDSELATSDQAVGLFASLLSIPPHEGFQPPSFSPEDWRVAVFETILQAISRRAAQKPLLLIVEDVHWIDPTSLDLLDSIIARSSTLPIFVLMTSRREELTARWSESDNFTHLQLNRLTPSQSRELCQEVVGSEAARTLHLEPIVKAAQGVPLFLEELAKHAQEAPAAQAAEKAANPESPIPHSTIPDHLFSFLAERLDRLDVQSGAKRVAQTAAVFGHDFSVALLAKIPSLRRVDDMQAAVDQLLNGGLVVRADWAVPGTLAFRHSIFREVAYESLRRSTRRALHGEIAAVLVETGLAEVEPAVAAYHFTEARKRHEAIAYWTKAGLRSNERSATAEAFSHFSKGLELIGELPDDLATQELELPLRVGFGAAASAIEGYSAQDIAKNYTRMLVLAGTLNRPRERFRAHLGLGAFYEVGGDIEKSQWHCEQCLRTAELSGDRDELLHAHRIMGELSFFKAEFEASCGHFETALPLYEARDHLRLIRELGDDPAVLSRVFKALSLWFLGFPDQAKESCRLGMELADRHRHAFSSAQADFYASWLYAFARDPIQARRFADKAIERCAAEQFSLVLGCSRVLKGWAMSRMNEQAAGQEEIEQGMTLIRGPNADICVSSMLTFVADYYLTTGDVKNSESAVEESRAVATERISDPDRLRLHGELLATRDPATAERNLREAVETAQRQKSLSMALRSALSLYRLLDKDGRTAEGRTLLKPIYERFTEGFDTADLVEAAAILQASHRPTHNA
jgi:class 3 adenylate cyclase